MPAMSNNPYQTPYPPYDQWGEEPPREHSKLGIVSTIIAGSVILLLIICIAIAMASGSGTPISSGQDFEQQIEQMQRNQSPMQAIAGCMIWLLIPAAVTGLILGIVGWARSDVTNPTFAIVGTIGNGLVLLSYGCCCALAVFGIAAMAGAGA